MLIYFSHTNYKQVIHRYKIYGDCHLIISLKLVRSSLNVLLICINKLCYKKLVSDFQGFASPILLFKQIKQKFTLDAFFSIATRGLNGYIIRCINLTFKKCVPVFLVWAICKHCGLVIPKNRIVVN